MKKLVRFYFSTLLSMSIVLVAAQTTSPDHYSEEPDQPYIPIVLKNRSFSAPYQLTTTGFSIRQVNVHTNGMNILGDAANEPSLTIDPTNPQRMAIGWRQFDTIASNFRQAGYAFTTDGGENWTFPGSIEPGVFRSDPVLDVDRAGNFYYNSLTSDAGNYTCHVFESESGTTSWDNGTFAYGGDKQWMAVDRTEGVTQGNIYAFWKTGLSSCSPGAFTRSLDNGMTYEPCETFPDDPTRGTLTVGPNGEVYACGGSGDQFIVLKSTNAGIADQSVTWDFSVTLDLGGPLALYAGPNPTGMLGQAWIASDHSESDTHGFVYLLGTVSNTSTGDPADILFCRSTDGGQTWSTPLRLHDDTPGNWQWFGSLSVAPDGRIDVTWLDTREHPGTYLSRLYYTYSQDGGMTWQQAEGLGEAFDPHLGFPQQTKIGDYYHQVSDMGGVHLAWAATFNGEEDIYYSYIEPELINTSLDNVADQSSIIYAAPNPSRTNVFFNYHLEQPGHVSLYIYDMQGSIINTLLNTYKETGDHQLEWLSDIPSGVYYYQFSIEGSLLATGKLIKI